MTSKMANNDSSNNEKQIYNTFDQIDTIIGISGDLNKLKTEVIAVNMFVTE